MDVFITRVGHGVAAGTLVPARAGGPWLGRPASPGITVVDTPGFNASVAEFESLVWLLAELRTVNLFIIVFKVSNHRV